MTEFFNFGKATGLWEWKTLDSSVIHFTRKIFSLFPFLMPYQPKIDGALTSNVTPGQSQPVSDDNEQVLHTPHISWTVSLSANATPYPGHVFAV